jgi:hypothetical protein
MSNQQPEADRFLQEHGIVHDLDDNRTTLEVAQAFGYVALESAGVDISED